MRSEQLERAREEEADPEDPETSQHLHRPGPLDEKENPVNDERNDPDIQQIDPAHAGLQVGE